MMESTTASESRAKPVRYIAAALAIIAGFIHFWVAPEHFKEAFEFGVFFVVIGAAQVAAGILLLVRPFREIIVATILGTLAVIIIYVVSRTTGLPFGPRSGEREPVGLMDLISKATEVALIGALVYLPRGRPLRSASTGNPKVQEQEHVRDQSMHMAAFGERPCSAAGNLPHSSTQHRKESTS